MATVFTKKVLSSLYLAGIVIFLFVLLRIGTQPVHATSPNWIKVGTPGFESAVTNEVNVSLAISTENIPYVAFSDTSASNKASVMKYNGTSWEYVGGAGFSSQAVVTTSNSFVTPISLKLDSTNNPYVAFIDSANSNQITVMKYDGANWVTVGTAGFTSGTVTYNNFTLDSNDIPYVAFANSASSYSITVKKYNGSNWVDVGSGGFANGFYLSFDIDSNNYPYIGYSGFSKITVKKYDGANWVTVGSEQFTLDGAGFKTLALDSNDTPYVLYQDSGQSYKATVMKYDGANWVTVGSAGFSSGQIYESSIVFDTNDTLYVMYKDSVASNKATVMKYDGANWVTVGSAGFSSRATVHPSLGIDSSNTLYAANPNDVRFYPTRPMINIIGGNFIEAQTNNGSLNGSRTFIIANDTFVNSSSSLVENTHYQIANKPSGLIAAINISADGSTATLTFSGQALNHSSSNSISNLTVTFLNGVFTNTSTASDVINNSNNAGVINFIDSYSGTVTLYGSDGAGNNSNSQLYTLNPENGEILTTIGVMGHNVNGMDFDPLSGILYGVTSNGDPDGDQAGGLFTIDTSSGLATYLGTIKDQSNQTLYFPDIAFRSNGTLYGYFSRHIYTIDTNCVSDVCSATQIGTMVISPNTGNGGGISFDDNDNLFILTDLNNGYYKINPDTGDVISHFGFFNLSSQNRVMTSAKFDRNNFLYATRNNFGSSPSDLIYFNPLNGGIISTGDNNPVMPFMTALAFHYVDSSPTPSPTPTPTSGPTSTPTPGSGGSSGGGSGSSGGSNPNKLWNFVETIMAGPNFVGIPHFITGGDGSSGGVGKIFIENDAHHDDMNVKITVVTVDELSNDTPKTPPPWSQGLNTYSDIMNFEVNSAFNGYPIPTLDHPATIILSYDPTKLGKLNSSLLRIAYFDKTTGRWVVIPENTVVNPWFRTVANTSTHVSTYYAVVYPGSGYSYPQTGSGSEGTNTGGSTTTTTTTRTNTKTDTETQEEPVVPTKPTIPTTVTTPPVPTPVPKRCFLWVFCY